MYRIYIVEDDKVISSLLSEHLRNWNYETLCASDFRSVKAEFDRFSPDLVLLDISLPFFNGYYWCSEIRRESDVPIVFISSAADNMNIVMAMNMGGDDFIAKPFDINVLVAKIGAILRRSYSAGGVKNIITRGKITLNLGSSVVGCGENETELTKNELRILQILLEHGGNAVSRDEMMTSLWENDSYVDDNTLTVNVTRLRKKLEAIGLADAIKTKKGIGYMVE